MKILYISDYFQPYASGASNISTYLMVKKLSETNNCYVITQKFKEEPWVYRGLSVYPLLPRYSAGKSIKDLLKVEILVFLKLQNIFEFYRVIHNFCKLKEIEVVNVESNNLMLLVALLFLHKPVVIDVRDYYLVCPFMLKTKHCSKHHLFCTPSGIENRQGLFVDILRFIFFRYKSFVYYFVKNIILKPLLNIRHTKYVFVANSNYVRKTLIKEFKNKINTQVIYNTINADDYSRKAVKKRVVLFASSLEEAKGVWNCIYTFEKFKSDILFEVVGDGPEMTSIAHYIKRRKIRNIKLLGKLEYKYMPPLYEKAYITVQPSVWPEPFGRYILESFASKTPLITTATGGTPEAIKDGETGLLIPANNQQELTKAMTKLLTNKKLYKHIQGNITSEAKKYHPDLIVKQRVALYNELVAI